MKIILKYILNNLKERKTRTAVMLLSIILSTALLFVSLSIGDSYATAQKKMSKGFVGKAALSIKALPSANGDPGWISNESVPTLELIKSKVGIIRASALYSEEGYFENFDIIAADLAELSRINKPRLLDGGEIRDFSGYKIALPHKFTAKYGIHEEDRIRLQIGEEAVEFQVAAIAAYDTVFLRQTRGFNALVPLDTMREIMNLQQGYSEILIEPADKVEPDIIKEKLSGEALKNKYRVLKVLDEKQVEADAREKSIPCFLISFFALIMSVFIIYSSYKVITTERLPVIGTFRSIGATEKAMTRILILESMVYGALGGLFGIPFSFIVLKVMLQGLGSSLTQGIEIPMVISPVNIVISCTAAIIVSVLSAYLPVRSVSKLPVKEIVLGMVEQKKLSNRMKLLFSVTILIISIILPRITSGKLQTLFGGAALLGVIAAAIVVAPFMITGIASVLERIYGRFIGNEGLLAARNMKRNKNVSQNITLLLISISAVITISVVCSFTKTYIGDVFKGSSLDGIADASMDKAFVQKVGNIKGMKKLSPIYVLEGNVFLDGLPLSRVEAVEDIRLFNDMLGIDYESNAIRKQVENSFNESRQIILNSDFIRKQGLKIGSTINVSFGDNVYKYHILGSFKSRADSSSAIISSEYAIKDFGVKNYGLLAFQAADPEAAIIQIRNLFGSKPNWSRTVKEFYADVFGVIDAFLSPMGKLTYFILILAAVGVINNLLINYIQKRRSTAMYKSVGLSNRQSIKMTLIEGFTSGVIGAAAGIAVSYIEVNTIFLVAGPRISIEPEIKISVFITAGIMGIVITLIGSFVPILKSLKMRIVEEIKI